jgi:act minimal PKS acyl carrier protein
MFTLDDVQRIMRGCAGAPDTVDLGADIAHVPFAELGYDSLAMLEMAAHVQQEFGIRIPDDAVEEMKTPQAAVDYVNRRFAGDLQG